MKKELMTREQIEEQTTELSDAQLIGATLTNPKDSGEMVATLLDAFEADHTDDYSDLGIALRAALNKQFNPIIKSEDFQDHLAKIRSPMPYYEVNLLKKSDPELFKEISHLSKIGKMIPDIKSADDLIDFIISSQKINGDAAKQLIDKVLPIIAIKLHNMQVIKSNFGLDLPVLEIDLKQLNDKSKELKKDYTRANNEVTRLSTKLIKLTPIITSGTYRETEKEAKAEKSKNEIVTILKTSPIRIDGLDRIKTLLSHINTSIPNEELLPKYFGPLERAIIARDTIEARSGFYNKEIYKTNEDIKKTTTLLNEEHKEGGSPETYAKILESMLKLATLTRKEPITTISKPTYQIQNLSRNNPGLAQAIEITSARYKELKKAGEISSEAIVPDASSLEALKQQLTGKVLKIEEYELETEYKLTTLEKEITILKAQNLGPRLQQRAEKELEQKIKEQQALQHITETALPQEIKNKKSLEQEIAHITKEIAVTPTTQKIGKALLETQQSNKIQKANIEHPSIASKIMQNIASMFARFTETIQSFFTKNSSEQPEDEIQNPLHPRESESLEHTEENPEQQAIEEDKKNQDEDIEGEGKGSNEEDSDGDGSNIHPSQ